ncbi:MAG: 50S ribosomal protein L15 [Candidatus Neomarinimicrobiota bacterium]
MRLDSLRSSQGVQKGRKRIGRGQGSGKGQTSGRGTKGYHSRSGSKRRAWYEGGQMPLQRRVPKRGFSNARFKRSYQIVNLSRIATLGLSEIDILTMKDHGLVKAASKPVKVLAEGELLSSIVVSANAFSRKAVEKIEKAGGEAVVV